MNQAAMVARRIASATRERGARCILRRTTMTVGPSPLPSPPILENPVLDGELMGGEEALNIRGDVVRGILQLGDSLIVGKQVYSVTGVVQSRPSTSDVSGFDDVPVFPPCVPTPDGAAVIVTSASDVITYAMINSFPRRLIDNDLIFASDLDVLLPAYGVSEPTMLTDRLLVAGKERTIVAVSPMFIRDTVVQWRIQAR